MTDPDLAESVSAAARDAAQMAMARWRTDFRRWEKTPGSPVCEVDLDVDRMQRARLAGIDPNAGWLSEETADDPARLACERVWVVEKPTTDGVVTSVEAFDGAGELMAMFFGVRKPGLPELEAWRALVRELPRRDRATAAA